MTTTGSDLWGDAPILPLGYPSAPTPNGSYASEPWEGMAPGDQRTAWWQLTPPESGFFALDAQQMGVDRDFVFMTVFEFLTPGDPHTWNLVGGGRGYPTELVELEGGKTYYLQVDSNAFGRELTFIVRWRRTETRDDFSPGFAHRATFRTTQLEPDWELNESGNTTFWPVGQQVDVVIEDANDFDLARGSRPPAFEEPRYVGVAPTTSYSQVSVEMAAWSQPFDYYVEQLWTIAGCVYTLHVSKGGTYTAVPGGFLNLDLANYYHPREQWPEDAVGVLFASDTFTYESTPQVFLDAEPYSDPIADNGETIPSSSTTLLIHPGFSAYTHEPTDPWPQWQTGAFSDTQWVASLENRSSVPVPGVLSLAPSQASESPEASVYGVSIVADFAVSGVKPAQGTSGFAEWQGDDWYTLMAGIKNIAAVVTMGWTSPPHRYLYAVDEVVGTLVGELDSTRTRFWDR